MIIPVITLWQPWASWIMAGWKTIETRTHNRFAYLEGKTIGIHAGLKWDEEAAHLASQYISMEQVLATSDFISIKGRLLGTAFVKQHRVLNKEDSKQALIDCKETKRYGLILEKLTLIAPIKISGKQGMWKYKLKNIDCKGARYE